MGTSTDRHVFSMELYKRCYYILGVHIDGMDVLEVGEATKFAIFYCEEVRDREIFSGLSQSRLLISNKLIMNQLKYSTGSPQYVVPDSVGIPPHKVNKKLHLSKMKHTKFG